MNENLCNETIRRFTIAGVLVALQALTACSDKSSTANNEKERDLIFAGEVNESFGFYKSSIKANDSGTLNVWIHFPKADPLAEETIQKLSDFYAEVSCKENGLRLIHGVDGDGTKILEGEKIMGHPPPTSPFYKLIFKICDEKL